MTREQLIEAIFKTYIAWSCPYDKCDIPKQERGFYSCYECAEKQLAEYEQNLISKAINQEGIEDE